MVLKMVLKMVLSILFLDGDDDSVDNGGDGADKHLTHFSQGVDCVFTERSVGNKLNASNEVNDVDDGADNGDDDSVEDVVDDSVEDNVEDGADKHLTHRSQGVDCYFTQRS
eukprot:924164-Ditylum_brightwellii.AAC.1